MGAAAGIESCGDRDMVGLHWSNARAAGEQGCAGPRKYHSMSDLRPQQSPVVRAAIRSKNG
jgi:hypothetical protein